MVKFAKAIAANTDLLTAQAFIFPHEDLILVLLISASGDDIFTQVRQLSSELETRFFSLDAYIPERLTGSLNFIKESLKQDELSVILACWKNISDESSTNVLYVESSGNLSALIIREGKVSPLISAEQSGQLISGYIHPFDRLLLLNNTVAERFTEERYLRLNLENFEDEVDSLAVADPQTPPLAGILIDFSPQTPTQEEAFPHTEITEDNIQQKILVKVERVKNWLIDSLPQGRKAKMYLVAFAILIILVLILVVVRKKGSSEAQLTFQLYLNNSQNEFNQAKALKDSDTEGAKLSLNKSKQDLSEALKIIPNDSAALDLKKQIEDSSADILKIQTVDNWPMFLDLGLLKTGFSSQRLSLSVGKVLLLDPNQKTLIVVDLAKKNPQILAGGDQLGKAEEASLNGDFGFVYSDRGVIRVDTVAIKTNAVIKPDGDWGRIADTQGFGGNIYLIDSIKNQIWKYTPTTTSFADKTAYLKDKADFSGTKKMMIDSSIWVLKSGGGLDKFTQGVSDSFNIGGLDRPIKDISTFFVSDETDNIYLVDAPNQRVVVLKKNGSYVSQILGDKFKTATDLMVDEKGKTLYLLEENKIYQIDLH